MQSFLHPSSFHDQLPQHIAVHVCPRFVGLPSQHSLGRLQPQSFHQLFALALCCPFLPLDHPGLLQKHLLHIRRADHSHVHYYLTFKHQGVPLWPVAAQMTGLAQICSRTLSHLPPCLHFKDLIPPCLLLLTLPSPPSTYFRPRERGHDGYVLLHLH